MSEPNDVVEAERPPGRTFSKKAPDVRRQELIEATFRCICRNGAEEMSVRTIAREAGLSLGMVRHHFRSKDELLAATLRFLSSRVQEQIAHAMADAGPSPMERLSAFITACLHPQELDHDYVRARFLFWGLAHTNETVRRVHDEIYARFEGQLRALITDVADAGGVEIDLDVVTLAMLAMLKGIWVEWSLAPHRVDPRKLAVQILPALDRTFAARLG